MQEKSPDQNQKLCIAFLMSLSQFCIKQSTLYASMACFVPFILMKYAANKNTSSVSAERRGTQGEHYHNHIIKERLAKAKEQSKQPIVAEGNQHRTKGTGKADDD